MKVRIEVDHREDEHRIYDVDVPDDLFDPDRPDDTDQIYDWFYDNQWKLEHTDSESFDSDDSITNIEITEPPEQADEKEVWE